MQKKIVGCFLFFLFAIGIVRPVAGGIDLGLLEQPLVSQKEDLLKLEAISVFNSKKTDSPQVRIEFEKLKVEQTGLSIIPGQRDVVIASAKEVLFDYGLTQHTQMRESVVDLYDNRLKILVEVLCSFCGYENNDCLFDDNIKYIIDNLKELSTDMLSDIKTAYQSALIKNNLDGTVSYDGKVYPYYLYTQTDPEWADLSYPYLKDYSRTIASSACGPTAMATILSSYFHQEILPTEVSDFSVQRGHRYDTGTATSLFSDAAINYGLPTPVTVYGKDIENVFSGIKNDGNMAIALMGRGRFTGSGHYVVLVGTEERNGKNYFIVADPNYPNHNYVLNHELIDDDPSDSFVLASPELIARECKDITWFQTDFKYFEEQYITTEKEVLLSSYTDKEFIDMIPVAISETIKDDTLIQIAREKQNDEYFLRDIR